MTAMVETELELEPIYQAAGLDTVRLNIRNHDLGEHVEYWMDGQFEVDEIVYDSCKRNPNGSVFFNLKHLGDAGIPMVVYMSKPKFEWMTKGLLGQPFKYDDEKWLY